MDCQYCNGNLMVSERLKWIDLVGQLKEIDNKLESLMHQKTRVSWFKNGDSCTKFFYSSLRWKRSRNEVKGVEVGGLWCEEPGTVRTEAKRWFDNRFRETKDVRVRLDAVEFKSLSMSDNLSLVEGFTEKEVRDAVWQCEGSKSPEPDGFNFNFLKKGWEFVKEDFMEVMNLFHETGYIPKGCNASLIALVPEVRNPIYLDQYKPISLVGALYKIISKVLVERIKKVLPMVIDDCQSAFLKNRGILDSVLMANEVIVDIRRRGKSGLCLKVDFEKAYNSVRWEFLYDMMHKMGFHRK